MNTLDHILHAFTLFLTQKLDIDAAAYPIVTDLNTDPAKKEFGDLNSNAPLVLTKALKRPPRELATFIAENFRHEAVEKIEVAGPGFLNFYLTPIARTDLAKALCQQGAAFFALSSDTPRHRYNLEFVSANPTGPLHLGHGRGGIIGDVLANVLNFIGHTADKEFYINDAGTQIQKLGASFRIRCRQAAGIDAHLPEDGYQGEYLVELAQTCYQEYGTALLEKPDSFFADYACTHLLAKIKETLASYGIEFTTWFSEKTLHDSNAVKESLEALTRAGHTFDEEGALWFRSTTFGDDKDRVLRKANGEVTYVAADVAYMRDKINRGYDHLIMILGQDHHSYPQRLHGIQKALGLEQVPLDVILYQLVALKESGQQLRMSKRAGRMVTLEDVIDEVGPDVARFFYLHRKADAHLDFDLDLALKKTEENPVYYIQYAFVRTTSILAKAQEHPGLHGISCNDCTSMDAQEWELIKKLLSLRSLLQTIAATYQTHLLAYYVIELANLFHSYYASHRVIDLENISVSRTRLFYVTLLRDTFKTCLELLEVSTPERM